MDILNYKNFPHADIIKENQTIIVPSIFMFSGGCEELFPFLLACRQANCTVEFKNEKLTVLPIEHDIDMVMTLTLYGVLGCNSKLSDDYKSYLSNSEKMTWDHFDYENL